VYIKSNPVEEGKISFANCQNGDLCDSSAIVTVSYMLSTLEQNAANGAQKKEMRKNRSSFLKWEPDNGSLLRYDKWLYKEHRCTKSVCQRFTVK
jgi:hypothetical protein